MADIAAYQHKFRANGDGPSQDSSKVTKRNRIPVSCLPCRTRKLKCNKSSPCESCIKRGEEAACSYRTTSSITRSKHASNGNVDRAQERLHHLEGLVMQLMQSDAPIKPAPMPDTTLHLPTLFRQTQLNGQVTPNDPKNEKDFKVFGGLLAADGSEPSYVGATHWAAILDNIKELKSDFTPARSPSDDEDFADPSHDSAHEDGLFGLRQTSNLESILNSLPPRPIVDRRLSAYFKSEFATIPIIHTYHFQRMYEAFWSDPFRAPVLWIAQLFAILCISAQLTQANGTEGPLAEGTPLPKDTFLKAATQCLVLGNFSKPQRYVMEALLLYTQCKYLNTLDPAGEVWIMFGVIVRQALRMGYHRDPKHFRMSVFEGEMRRRIWATIRHFDLMNSFQTGLPSSIQSGQYDTALPLNLEDSDFDESSTILPPARPEGYTNKMTYFIAKGIVMTVFEKILNQELSLLPVPYDRVMELDTEIRQALAAVPQPMKHKPMAQSFADPPHVIMLRLSIELLYQKSLCVLHRKYLTQGSSSPYSRNVCSAAAMEILNLQATVHQEAEPGGQLYQDRWMLSSFTYNDFFLAAMILCLDVSTSHQNEQNGEGDDRREMKIDMLQRSYYICSEQKSTSKEARRVTEALATMLGKLRPSFTSVNTALPGSSADNSLSSPMFSLDSSGAASGREGDNGSITGSLEDIMSGPENIDWAFLDQYLLDPSISGNLDPSWPDPALLGYLDTRSNSKTHD